MLQRRILADSDYALGVCLEHNCNRLIVGKSEIYRGSLFRKAGVHIKSQDWQGPAILPARDLILDAVARMPAADILKAIKQNYTGRW